MNYVFVPTWFVLTISVFLQMIQSLQEFVIPLTTIIKENVLTLFMHHWMHYRYVSISDYFFDVIFF